MTGGAGTTDEKASRRLRVRPGSRHMVEPETIFRRFLLWAAICCVSAAPSFAWAHEEFHRGAMVLGVALFTIAYTAFTSTERFEQFHRRPFVRRTLYIGYGARMAATIILPVGAAVDLLPGMLSVNLVQQGAGLDPHTFGGTLLTTIAQGTLLNVLLGLFMLFVYGIQRLTMKPPEAVQGFEVVMPVVTLEPKN